ncbi:MAG: membrane protein insertase YidC [Pseudoxanthomonas sp.]
MKNIRIFLWVGLALILFVNYQTWVLDYKAKDDAAKAAEVQAAEAANAAAPLAAEVPQAGVQTAAQPVPGTTPAATTSGTADVPTVPAPNGSPQPAPAGANAVATAPVINVRTDVLDVDVSLRGGELLRADLLAYPVQKGKAELVRLLRNNGTGDQYLLQTGLAGVGAEAATGEYPTHLVNFSSDSTSFVLQPGMDELRVPLTWTSASGVSVVKTLVFRRGGYRVDIEYAVTNGSQAAWSVAPYEQILHDRPPVKRSYFNVNSYAFTGPALYDGEKYQKLKVTDAEDANLDQELTGAWMAALQHHFVTAIVPARDEANRYTLRARSRVQKVGGKDVDLVEFRITVVGPTHSIAAGASEVIKETVYVGPKLQQQLDAIHPELSRAADYGMLTFLSRPLFWLLEKAHSLFRNWGFAIIAVTFLLKLLFYPLSEASGRSMAKMKLVAPRIKQIQETYKDDREKLGRATMELYKKEKVNPAASCLPMLIQLPVFLAFYWVLLESVEMRQAPFVGWIQDLSVRDPLFILPAIMAAAMFVQYKLNPAPPDPIQAKVMMILPLVMSVTFAFFPAGLVLYWVTNTLLTIAQQWNINRRIEAANAPRD